MLTDLIVTNYIALVVEIFFYGIYLVVLVGTTWITVRRRRTWGAASLHPVFGVCSWILLVCLTSHCVCNMLVQYHGLVALGPDPTAANAYLSDARALPCLVRSAVYALAAVVFGVMLIFRLWVVWGCSWLVAATPAAALLASAVVWILGIYMEVHAPGEDTRIWWYAASSLQAVISVVYTVLILIRTLREHPLAAPKTGGRAFMPIAWPIVESAAIYTTLSLLTMAFLLVEHPAYIVLSDIMLPIIGISASLLVARIGIEMTAGERPPLRMSAMPSLAFPDDDVFEHKLAGERNDVSLDGSAGLC